MSSPLPTYYNVVRGRKARRQRAQDSTKSREK